MSGETEPDEKKPEPKTLCTAMLAFFGDEARRRQAAYEARRRAWYAALVAVGAATLERDDWTKQGGPRP